MSVTDNSELNNVFDFNNFLDNTRMGKLVNVDNIALKNFVVFLLDVFSTSALQNTKEFVSTKYGNALIDYTFTKLVAPSLASQSSNFSASNNVQVQYVKNQVNLILNSSMIDWSDMNTIQQQLVNLPSSLFAFGSNFTPFGQTFDVNAFKTSLVNIIMENMYPAFYYRHIVYKVSNCDNLKCKRSYLLAQYVFVYYSFMSIFLAIFSSSATVQKFNVDTGLDMTTLGNMKIQIVLVLDGILSLLQDENLLDSTGNGQVSSITQYYNSIKTLSDNNVLKSTYLSDEKRKVHIMHNNLSNHTNSELVSYNDYIKAKRSLLWTIFVMVLVILFLIGLLLKRSFLILYASCALVLLGLAINGLVAVILQSKQ
jgi:hypothetical protein